MKTEGQNTNFPKPMLGVVLTYGLSFDENRLQWVTIEATKYDEQTNEPITWAVRRGGSVMSKFTGSFDYEPLPSSRDDDFFDEYRFSTPEEAAECWSKHYAYSELSESTSSSVSDASESNSTDLETIENKIIEFLNEADDKLDSDDFSRLAESIIDYVDEIARSKGEN